MQKEIVIDINPYQTRVVLIEDGSPSEIYIERRGRERLVGNIYKGKVQNVLPGMQAAFVDIGLERNAFLYAGDIVLDKGDFQFGGHEGDQKLDEAPNIKDIVKPGQDIMVQIIKEPVGTKGARVTTHVTLPGRSLVLMPTVNYIGVSRRIDDEEERARLKAAIEVRPQCIADTFEGALWTSGHLDHDSVGMSIDFANLLLTDPLLNLTEAIRTMRSRMVYCHFKNLKFYPWGHDWDLGLRAGSIDYFEVLAAMRQTGYEGWIGLEYCGSGDPDAFIADDINYLRWLEQRLNRADRWQPSWSDYLG